jgi:uncharacterized protein
MIGKKRHLAEKISKLLEMFPVVAILGARQVGKTTLAKILVPNWHYLDLENPNDAQRIQDDPILFFQQYPEHVIIDEAQLIPAVFKVLRGVIDEKRQHYGRYILTGSSSPALLQQISETLAGRIAIVELGTLKASEYYDLPLSPFYRLLTEPLHKDNLIQGTPPISNEQIAQLWLKGGYPEPIVQEDTLKYNVWFEQYYSTYINRDISLLFPKLNRVHYQRFIYMLSRLSGTILNRSDLARTLEINESTVRDYLKIADGTFLWRELASYDKQIAKVVIKMPRGHVRDSGLLHHLLHINSLESLHRDPILGHSFESFVIEEILKGLEASFVTNWNAYYYRTRAGAEIDLILEGTFGLLPIEIKYSTHVKLRQLHALGDFIKEKNLPFGIVVNPCDAPYWLTNNIIQIPVGWL